MPRTMTALALAAIGSSLAPSMPAIAQSTGTQLDTRSAITVLAPRVRESRERSASGFPIQTLTAQSVVYIDDLDLRTETGRSELSNRVNLAAKEACDWIDQVYPLAQPSDADCQRDAVKRAQDQVDSAIAKAGG